MKSTADILKSLPYFSDLDDELLEAVCEGSEQVNVPPETTMIEEGTHSEEMYVIVEGELRVEKQTGDKQVELARLKEGDVVGEIALLDGAARTATVISDTDSLLVKVPGDTFEKLLGDPRVVRRMFRTVTSRLRNIEETLRHEERMAALGRMAAQLMHELNNPAAAVGRTSQALSEVSGALGKQAVDLASNLGDDLELNPPDNPPELSPLDRSEREDGIAFWLEDLGVPDPWDLAPGLVVAGWTQESLDRATAGAPESLKPGLVRWLGLRASADQLTDELRIGATRISELVRIVKEYSYLDQAPVQELDVRTGIKDTLVLMKHKTKAHNVDTHLADDLMLIEAPGRELNQIWTNLIDNAADAMEPGGTLTISARNSEDGVIVEFADTGSGIPDHVAEKIFDPFFTTKEPGKGTGLGLHTVNTIVDRVGGKISVDSSEHGTKFTVSLPATTPRTT